MSKLIILLCLVSLSAVSIEKYPSQKETVARQIMKMFGVEEKELTETYSKHRYYGDDCSVEVKLRSWYSEKRERVKVGDFSITVLDEDREEEIRVSNFYQNQDKYEVSHGPDYQVVAFQADKCWSLIVGHMSCSPKGFSVKLSRTDKGNLVEVRTGRLSSAKCQLRF